MNEITKMVATDWLFSSRVCSQIKTNMRDDNQKCEIYHVAIKASINIKKEITSQKKKLSIPIPYLLHKHLLQTLIIKTKIACQNSSR